jgi:hypothetical protein
MTTHAECYRKADAACARTERARTVNELNHLILYLSAQTTVGRHRIP